ncbi:DNA mismatch repair protein MutL [Clostridium sp. DSM 8431]|uniref:DNA mismatch repair endonuclease MutL n=1 Tax=Clostridium sp. DSM 8431 TaxID=1761781 RepID=UPI0008E8AAF7|nr:DNA mismatch repair endonuclease MutL [Clostridium sp. DSM 8431]SFU32922.1 DNA mismatch repair protein MutL [Clostridium sp. DSM 8431]
MKRINLLDESTSNKIAAGEVVERPASVVKELIENSIDAQAKNITIEIEEGGISLMKIIDDGTGIHPDDIKKAFMPHATSKIKTSEDIYSIQTLGFRGEALPSIASVAKVNLKSRIEGNDFGYELDIEAGNVKSFEECGVNKGTTIEVRDLFFNVPARKKFLKSTSREGSLINDIVNRTAIAHPDISFKLINNGKKVLHTFGSGKLKDVLRTVYGKTISENILYFEEAGDAVTIYGYVGKEEIARGSRNNQSIFVNGRYIKHKTIVAAVEQAFKSFSTCNKFPFFVLFVEVYPELVDVNIHPTKAEIKFTDDRMIFKKVFDAVHRALKEDVFEDFKLPEEKKEVFSPYKEDLHEEIKLDIKPASELDYVKMQSFERREKVEDSSLPQAQEVSLPVDLKSPKVAFETSEIIKEDSFKPLQDTREEIPYFKSEDKTSEFSYDTYKIEEDNSNKVEVESINNTTLETKEPETSKSQVNSEERIAKFPPLRIIGQFNKTYILGEYDEVLYMIDQHAAHEKIMFEKYLKDIEEESLIVQPLLIPCVIDLSSDDLAYYEENADIFKNAGFALEEFGGNTLSLKEVPYFLGKLEPKNLFLSILDNLKSLGSGKTTEVKYNKIATMACKSAVKGNDSLTDSEMIKLVQELRYIDDPFHCPHGRPTIIKFSNYDLEKKFRRIV